MSAIYYDDAYITFRYVENAVAGNGLVYNVGERALGATSGLYLLLLTGLAALGLSPLQAGPWLNILIVALVPVAVFLVAVRLGYPWPALAIGVALAVDLEGLFFYRNLRFGISSPIASGMETGLYIAAIWGALLATLLRRPNLAMTIAALAVLARPDGLLVLVIVLGWTVLVQKKWPIRGLIAALVILLPWFIFATIYYGSPIPNTIIAKAIVWSHPDTMWERTPVVTALLWFLPPWMLPGYLVGAIVLLRRLPQSAPFLIWQVLYTLAFTFAQRSEVFRWYLTPALSVYTAVAVLGYVVIGKWVAEFVRSRNLLRWSANAVATAAIVIVIGYSLLAAYSDERNY